VYASTTIRRNTSRTISTTSSTTSSRTTSVNGTTTVVDAGSQRIADDTHLVRLALTSPGIDEYVHCNSMVIAGTEPVLVDVGPRVARREWLDQVASVVDLADVRWIFLSHDDADHVGNLGLALASCPRATVVTSWLANRRMLGEVAIPPHRQRWLRDGEAFRAGDRRLVAVRPPLYDAPTTRGLFDPTTGVYWAADAFGTPVTAIVDSVADLDPYDWAMGAMTYASWLSPWHTMLDPVRWAETLDAVRRLRPSAIASAHGPLVPAHLVETAIGHLSGLATQPLAPTPGQFELDDVLAGVR
jgi:flavorubredoxin